MVTQAQLDKLHEDELLILAEIDRVCSNNGLRYYVGGGTALGAVRHQGFIPWDDDLDIDMPRQDYRLFKTLFPLQAKPEFFLQSRDNDEWYPNAFMKVRLKGTRYGSVRDLRLKEMGVWVDIFPSDLINAESLPALIRYRRAVDLSTAYSANRILPENQRTPKWDVIVKTVHPRLVSWILHNEQARFETNIAVEGDVTLVAETLSIYPPSQSVYPLEVVLPFAMSTFCDMTVPVPADVDRYLRIVYGDYMTPPPEEERVPTHTPDIVEV